MCLASFLLKWWGQVRVCSTHAMARVLTSSLRSFLFLPNPTAVQGICVVSNQHFRSPTVHIEWHYNNSDAYVCFYCKWHRDKPFLPVRSWHLHCKGGKKRRPLLLYISQLFCTPVRFFYTFFFFTTHRCRSYWSKELTPEQKVYKI